MLRSPKRAVLAECGDLALAKECLADLRAANFRGTTQILQRSVRDNYELLRSHAYGSVSGTAIAQSMMVGVIIGALVSGVIVVLLPPSTAAFTTDLTVVAVSVVLGGLVGALLRYRFLKSKDLNHAALSNRFLIRCEGEPAQLATTFDVLGTSACQKVVFDEGKSTVAESGSSIPRRSGSVSSVVS